MITYSPLLLLGHGTTYQDFLHLLFHFATSHHRPKEPNNPDDLQHRPLSGQHLHRNLCGRIVTIIVYVSSL
jgi:hypothetical protein